jgi:excisionase family DNA binding protein
MTEDKLLSAAEAAAELGVSKPRVLALIKAKRLPAQLVGTSYVIRAADLEMVRERKPGKPPSDNPSPSALYQRARRLKAKK